MVSLQMLGQRAKSNGKQWLSRICACTLSVMVLGCATQDEALKPAELAFFDATARVKNLWHASLDSNVRASGIGPFKAEKIYSRPMFGGAGYQRFYLASDESFLYACNDHGRIYSIAKESGDVIWRTDVDKTLTAGISHSEGKLFVATNKGEILALDALSGDILWNSQVSTEVVALPVSNGTEVLVSAIDGRLFSLDAVTGKPLWNYDHPQPLLTFRTQGAPLVVGSQAIVGFDNGQMLSFGTKEGDLRWAVRVSQPQGITELERAVDLDVTPLSAGPFVLIGGANGRIVAAARGTGKISWAEDASLFNELAADDTNIYYIDEDSHIFSRRLSSGQEVWKNETLHRRNVYSPTIVGDRYLAAIDDKNFLHVFEASSGSIAARISLPGNSYSAPMVAEGNRFFVFSENGALSAYAIEAKNE